MRLIVPKVVFLMKRVGREKLYYFILEWFHWLCCLRQRHYLINYQMSNHNARWIGLDELSRNYRSNSVGTKDRKWNYSNVTKTYKLNKRRTDASNNILRAKIWVIVFPYGRTKKGEAKERICECYPSVSFELIIHQHPFKMCRLLQLRNHS